MVMTKEELEKRVKELEAQVEELTDALTKQHAKHLNERYEMLTRIYPYMANEIDSLRGMGR
jgi:archaellum component FlaC